MAEKGLLGAIMGQGETPPKSLAESKNPVQFLMQLASERPEYAALTEYLQSRNAMPPIAFDFLPSGATGQFVQRGFFSDGSVPATGKVTLSDAYVRRGLSPESAIPTLTHELTHATQKEMDTQRRQKDVVDQQAKQQFLEGHAKLSYDRYKKGRAAFAENSLANKLDPQWTAENEAYRASNQELPAWAMGAVANRNPRVPYDPYNAPAHLNPTLATERQILLDLATRDARANPNKKNR
jgi:hypothetical protein